MVKILVEKAKINVNSTNSSGFTPLHIAAKNGFMDICKYLIDETPVDEKSDILIKGLDGETPY